MTNSLNNIQDFEERQNEMLAQLQKLVSHLHVSPTATEFAEEEETIVSLKIEDIDGAQNTIINDDTYSETASPEIVVTDEIEAIEIAAENTILSPLKLDEKPTGEATSLVEKVMLIMKDRIAALNLAAGTRLPSIRRLAVTMEVSKSTIVEAYDRLEQQGIIQARRGSGFFVATRSHFTLVIEPKSQTDTKRFNRFTHITKLLNPPVNMIAAGSGSLPANWLPQIQIEHSLRDLIKDGDSFAHYDDPQGFAPLRSSLAERIKSPALNVSPDNLLITDSATHALDLICRYLLQAGDTVLIDEPCSFVFLNMLQAHRVKAIAVPFTDHGPDLDIFAKFAAMHHPRLYITNAGFQNPTGASITPVHAHRLITIADQHNITLIEDHSYAELNLSGATYLTELDGLNRTIRIGGFSKTISPAIRTGYIAAKASISGDLTTLKLSTNMSTSNLSLKLVNSIINNEQYSQNLTAINCKINEAYEQAGNILQKTGLIIRGGKNSGLFIWAELPNNMDASALALTALDENILLAPGELFSQNSAQRSYMRFNVTQSNNKQLTTFLKKMIS